MSSSDTPAVESAIRHLVFDSSLLSALDQELAGVVDTLRLDVDANQRQMLLEYLALFHKWNKTYNLSSIREPRVMLVKHIADSLSIIPHFQAYLSKNPHRRRFIDVGTGGGLPGIPLSIMFPELEFLLVDSAGKKTRFLFQVKQSLSLDNVQVKHTRIEEFQPEQLFDGVFSRAFASLDDMTRCCAHVLDMNGLFWAMKGVFPRDELRDVEKNYKVVTHHSLHVPNLGAERCLIVLSARNASV